MAYTVPSLTTSYTFTTIPSTYTDLRIVAAVKLNGTDNTTIRLNGDTGSNYSSTYLGGSGSAASSGRFSNTTSSYLGYQSSGAQTFDIMNYANSTTNKTIICRSNDAGVWVEAAVGLWRSTAAITSVTLRTYSTASYDVGTTFTLYGIKAA